MKVIAHIESDFNTKFGVPRQSGVVPELTARIIFEPEYRVAEAFRGLEDFTHIWILWCFSEAVRDEWNPTVRPPRFPALCNLTDCSILGSPVLNHLPEFAQTHVR